MSVLVGIRGRVYAHTREQLGHCDPSETASVRALESSNRYRHVVFFSPPANEFAAPQKLDAIWISQNHHDLHDKCFGPADVKLVNKRSSIRSSPAAC